MKKLKELVSAYENALENDYCTYGDNQGNSPSEIINKIIRVIKNE